MQSIALWHLKTFELNEKAIWLDVEEKMFSGQLTQTTKIEDTSEVVFLLAVLKYRYCSDMASRMIDRMLGTLNKELKTQIGECLSSMLEKRMNMRYVRAKFGHYEPVEET